MVVEKPSVFSSQYSVLSTEFVGIFFFFTEN